MSRRLEIFTWAVLVAVAVSVVVVASGPHDWVGRLACEVRGGEWTNRYSTGQESLVTAGRRCEGL